MAKKIAPYIAVINICDIALTWICKIALKSPAVHTCKFFSPPKLPKKSHQKSQQISRVRTTGLKKTHAFQIRLLLITRGLKAPESRFRLCFFLLFVVFWISWAVTKPKRRYWALVLKWKFYCTIVIVSLRSSGVGIYWSGKVGNWCFLAFFLFINSSPPLILYRHIVAAKATIDKQSPHAKLLCLNIFNEVEISSFWSWQKI